MYGITHKEYEAIRNLRNFSVVSFKDGKRVHTYSGLTLTQAVDEVMFQQMRGHSCLIIRDLPDNEVSRNIEDYNKYILNNSFLFKED